MAACLRPWRSTEALRGAAALSTVFEVACLEAYGGRLPAGRGVVTDVSTVRAMD